MERIREEAMNRIQFLILVIFVSLISGVWGCSGDDGPVSPGVTKNLVAAFIHNAPDGYLPGNVINFVAPETMKDGTQIVSYSWNWDDDSDVEVVDRKTISHTFESIGTYTVILSVVDNVGRTSSTSTEITVDLNNDPPSARFTYYGPEHWQPGTTITFDASSSSDPDGDLLTYTWDWGYGPVSENLTDPITTHQFNLEGECEVSLTVTDSFGLSDVAESVSFSFGYPYGNRELTHISLGDLVWDFALNGDYMYVAAGSAGFRVIDISNPSSPIVLPVQITFDESARWVRLHGDHAVVMTQTDGIEPDNQPAVNLLDVSSPSNPALLGSYEITESNLRDIAFNGSRAYISFGTNLRIVDFTDPENPQETAIIDNGVNYQSIYIRGNTMFVNILKHVEIYDISNPDNPELISQYPDPSIRTLYNFKVIENIMYVMRDYTTMEIVDVSDPADPVYLGEVITNSAYRMTESGSFAVTSNSYGDALAIVDMSNLSAPEYLCTFTPVRHSKSLQGVDHYVYLGCSDGFSIVDIGNPYGPRYIDRYISDFDNMLDFEFSNNLVYSCGKDHYLEIVDITDPANPVGLGSYTGPGYAYSIGIRDNLALVGTLDYGLCIFDISDPCNPYMISRLYDNGYYWINDICIVGDLAYITMDLLQCVIVDISDPSNPFELGRYRHEGSLCGFSITVKKNYCYVGAIENPGYADTPYALAFEVNNLGNIKLIWSKTYTEKASYKPDIAGDNLFLYAGVQAAPNRVEVYDISTGIPSFLCEQQVPNNNGRLGDIEILGDYMYLIKLDNGLAVYDISDIYNFSLVSYIPTDTHNATELAISKNRAVVASESLYSEGYNFIQLW